MTKGISKSLLAMCRCTVALAYVDGVFAKEERKLLSEYFDTLPLTNNQLSLLREDMRVGNMDYYLLYRQITDVCDRAHLINFAKVLFYSDGEFSQIEKDVLNVLVRDHMADINDKKGVSARTIENMIMSNDQVNKIREQTSGSSMGGAVGYLSRTIHPDEW